MARRLFAAAISAATLFALVVLTLAVATPAHAERRVALVIGNGAYQHAPRLPNPRNDAQDVTAALKHAGFDTMIGLDLDKSGMEELGIRFARAAREADVALFYYSGHAMQFNGINYLMPVDAKLTDEADLRRMARLDDIVADLQRAKNLKILVLDSCRDNPLAEALKRSIGRTRGLSIQRGLAKIESPQGMIVAYATQAGSTAADGNGRNSPYTTAFLKHIGEQAEIGAIFRRISADVYQTTKRSQVPELSLSLIGEFYLKGRPAPAASVPALDELAWKFLSATTDIVALRRFVAEFPASARRREAEARIAALERQTKPVRQDDDRAPAKTQSNTNDERHQPTAMQFPQDDDISKRINAMVGPVPAAPPPMFDTPSGRVTKTAPAAVPAKRDDIAKQIESMVGPIPPPPPPSIKSSSHEVSRTTPPKPDDIGKRIESMIGPVPSLPPPEFH
jgi:uncharacterized caspase-like protein